MCSSLFVLDGIDLKLLKQELTFPTSFCIVVIGTCKRKTGKCKINENGTGQRGTNWKAERRN